MKKISKPKAKKAAPKVETVPAPIPEQVEMPTVPHKHARSEYCAKCGQIIHNHFFKDRKCKPHHHDTFTPEVA